MLSRLRYVLPASIAFVAVACSPLAARAQFYKLHGGSLSVGATGNFTTVLTSNPISGTFTVPQTGGGVLNTTVSNQQQFTTLSTGFLTSLQIHPKPWAGVEFNYGFNHYSERYAFNYATTTTAQSVNVPVDTHEATAAYQFHPRFIPFQPFVNIGGGAIDFSPGLASNQWRSAGLLETGFDLPASKRIGFRIEGRALVYRAPNFFTSSISTRSWRVTEQPSVSAYYRF